MIYAGVVLLEPIILTHLEMTTATDEELGEKYGWAEAAPNLQAAHELHSRTTRIRATVPCITSLAES